MVIPKLRSPIVLVHGLFGFDRLGVAGTTLANYFPRHPRMLEAAGNRVLVPCLSRRAASPTGPSSSRTFSSQHSPGEPVHLIAHSMGGLDARYMISCLDMADHVLTLTTLGTPHRGTSFADWGVSRLERIVRPVLELYRRAAPGLLRSDPAAVARTSTTRCRRCRECVISPSRGKHDGSLLHPEWLLPYSIVRKA